MNIKGLSRVRMRPYNLLIISPRRVIMTMPWTIPPYTLRSAVPDFETNQAAEGTIERPETPYLDPDDFADVPRDRGREGLPPKFRMRHASHYVEQLMGDAPIQSVRQIPIDQIVAPEVNGDVS